MKKHHIVRALKIVAFVVLAAAALSYVVMRLWNGVVPSTFGWHAIGYWQALSLLVLSRILFGGFRGAFRGPGGNWRRRMRERWEQMTPEQREKFRESMRAFSGVPPASAEPKP